jgi:hypothetical protein
MAIDVLIMEKEGFIRTFVEKKQSVRTIAGFEKFGYEGKQLFNRKGVELFLDYEYFSSLIDNLQKKVMGNRREAHFILPFSTTWYHTLDVEEVPKNKNEAYEFVLWKISKLIPIPKEQIEIRIDTISLSRELTTLLVAVTYKTFIFDIEKCFREKGIDLTVIMPPTIAILNALEPYLNGDAIILWLKENGFSMIGFLKGIPRYIRELDQTLPLEKLDTELYSFMSAITKSEGISLPERIIFFDELNREELIKFLPPGSTQVKLETLNIKSGLQTSDFEKFVIAVGAAG